MSLAPAWFDGRVSVPEVDVFFAEGQAAFAEGQERSDCPYGEGTDGECGWRRGYDCSVRQFKQEEKSHE